MPVARSHASAAPPSGRLLVQKLAAHVVHLLNEGQEVVAVVPLRLRAQLAGTLAGQRYLDGLVGFRLMALPSGSEAAAQRYLEHVLDRRQQLARSLPRHKAHDLFLATCRRGAAAGWATTRLERRPAIGDDMAQAIGGQAIGAPADFPPVAERMGRVDRDLTPGNPAAGTRERLGPLWLVVDGVAAQVAEELSLWQAVTIGPLRLRKLPPGSEFDALCSLTIQALEAANAHWSALVSLGLWPPDWLDAVSVNTAKKAAAFVSAVRAAQPAGFDNLDVWRAVWVERSVPGHASPEALWHSSLGLALRGPRGARIGAAFDEPADEGDYAAQVLDEIEFAQRLDLAREAGVIDEFDVWFLSRLAAGEEIAGLAGMPQTRQHFAGRPVDLDAFAADLSRRLYDFARRQEP